MQNLNALYTFSKLHIDANIGLSNVNQNEGPRLGQHGVIRLENAQQAGQIRQELLNALNNNISREQFDRIRHDLGVGGNNGQIPETPLTGREIVNIIDLARATPKNIKEALGQTLRVATMPASAQRLLHKVLAKCSQHPDVSAFLSPGDPADAGARLKALRQSCTVVNQWAEAHQNELTAEEKVALAYLLGFSAGEQPSEVYNAERHDTPERLVGVRPEQPNNQEPLQGEQNNVQNPAQNADLHLGNGIDVFKEGAGELGELVDTGLDEGNVDQKEERRNIVNSSIQSTLESFQKENNLEDIGVIERNGAIDFLKDALTKSLGEAQKNQEFPVEKNAFGTHCTNSLKAAVDGKKTWAELKLPLVQHEVIHEEEEIHEEDEDYGEIQDQKPEVMNLNVNNRDEHQEIEDNNNAEQKIDGDQNNNVGKKIENKDLNKDGEEKIENRQDNNAEQKIDGNQNDNVGKKIENKQNNNAGKKIEDQDLNNGNEEKIEGNKNAEEKIEEDNNDKEKIEDKNLNKDDEKKIDGKENNNAEEKIENKNLNKGNEHKLENAQEQEQKIENAQEQKIENAQNQEQKKTENTQKQEQKKAGDAQKKYESQIKVDLKWNAVKDVRVGKGKETFEVWLDNHCPGPEDARMKDFLGQQFIRLSAKMKTSDKAFKALLGLEQKMDVDKAKANQEKISRLVNISRFIATGQLAKPGLLNNNIEKFGALLLRIADLSGKDGWFSDEEIAEVEKEYKELMPHLPKITTATSELDLNKDFREKDAGGFVVFEQFRVVTYKPNLTREQLEQQKAHDFSIGVDCFCSTLARILNNGKTIPAETVQTLVEVARNADITLDDLKDLIQNTVSRASVTAYLQSNSSKTKTGVDGKFTNLLSGIKRAFEQPPEQINSKQTVKLGYVGGIAPKGYQEVLNTVDELIRDYNTACQVCSEKKATVDAQIKEYRNKKSDGKLPSELNNLNEKVSNENKSAMENATATLVDGLKNALKDALKPTNPKISLGPNDTTNNDVRKEVIALRKKLEGAMKLEWDKPDGRHYADKDVTAILVMFERLPPSIMTLMQDNPSSMEIVMDLCASLAGVNRLAPGQGHRNDAYAPAEPSQSWKELVAADKQVPPPPTGKKGDSTYPIEAIVNGKPSAGLELPGNLNGTYKLQDNHGGGDCMFYAFLDGFNALQNNDDDKVDASAGGVKALRMALYNHITRLREQALGDTKPAGFKEDAVSWTVATGDCFVNAQGAMFEYLGIYNHDDGIPGNIQFGSDMRDLKFWGDGSTGAFLADMVKRPVVIIEDKGSVNLHEIAKFDRDLTTGQPLQGDPIVLYHSGVHYQCAHLDQAGMQSVKTQLAHPVAP